MIARNAKLPEEQKRLVPYCTRCMTNRNLHAHHRIPLYKGGEDALNNLTTLCSSCHFELHNLSDGDNMHEDDYEDWLWSVPPRWIGQIYSKTLKFSGVELSVTAMNQAFTLYKTAKLLAFGKNGLDGLVKCGELEILAHSRWLYGEPEPVDLFA